MRNIQKILEGKDDEKTMVAYAQTARNPRVASLINAYANMLHRAIEEKKFDGLFKGDIEHSLHYLIAYMARGGDIKINFLKRNICQTHKYQESKEKSVRNAEKLNSSKIQPQERFFVQTSAG